jgi:hypothetical protein
VECDKYFSALFATAKLAQFLVRLDAYVISLFVPIYYFVTSLFPVIEYLFAGERTGNMLFHQFAAHNLIWAVTITMMAAEPYRMGVEYQQMCEVTGYCPDNNEDSPGPPEKDNEDGACNCAAPETDAYELPVEVEAAKTFVIKIIVPNKICREQG